MGFIQAIHNELLQLQYGRARVNREKWLNRLNFLRVEDDLYRLQYVR